MVSVRSLGRLCSRRVDWADWAIPNKTMRPTAMRMFSPTKTSSPEEYYLYAKAAIGGYRCKEIQRCCAPVEPCAWRGLPHPASISELAAVSLLIGGIDGECTSFVSPEQDGVAPFPFPSLAERVLLLNQSRREAGTIATSNRVVSSVSRSDPKIY